MNLTMIDNLTPCHELPRFSERGNLTSHMCCASEHFTAALYYCCCAVVVLQHCLCMM